MTHPPAAPADAFQKAFLLLLVAAISLLFLAMVRDFLMALLLAAIFSAMFHPFYAWLTRRFRGRRALAAASTIAIVLLAIVLPLSGFLGLVANQAVDLSQEAGPWVERRISESGGLTGLAERLPFLEVITPYQEQILSRLGDVASRVGTFVLGLIATAARGTAMFLLLLFVMLYAMFFFLMTGTRTLDQILYYTPLRPEQEARMVGRFVSVTRATIKGTIIIGSLQGGLCGLALFVLGIEGAALWTAVMIVLSIIPTGVGGALVWVPAAVYLFANGRPVAAIGLIVWCGALVGLVDNVLRPRLVGRDTEMSDLLILLSTLGGLILFGVVGILIGPIVAGLFVTVWDIYGTVFKDWLPPIGTRAEQAPTA
jgi:predicted PurR-regulated permease PerM